VEPAATIHCLLSTMVLWGISYIFFILLLFLVELEIYPLPCVYIYCIPHLVIILRHLDYIVTKRVVLKLQEDEFNVVLNSNSFRMNTPRSQGLIPSIFGSFFVRCILSRIIAAFMLAKYGPTDLWWVLVISEMGWCWLVSWEYNRKKSIFLRKINRKNLQSNFGG